MQSELIKKLQELNQTYRTNCKVKFIDSDHSYYHQGVITLGLESKDSLWTLCHEFKHFLQDHKKNYLYLLKHKIITRSILHIAVIVFIYFLIFPNHPVTENEQDSLAFAQIIFMCWLGLNVILLIPPVLFPVKELYKNINHHLEFEADRFATKHSGLIPYQSKACENEESLSHPSWNSRIATLEEEFPYLKKN